MRYLFILLVVVVLAGCSKGSAGGEGTLDTLTVSDECTDTDLCCETQCKDHCMDNSRIYAKHLLNFPHCACWCD